MPEPTNLERIIRKACAFNPNDRYPDMGAVLKDLDDLNHQVSIKKEHGTLETSVSRREKNKKHAELAYQAARSYISENRYPLAIEELKKAIKFDPNNNDAWAALQWCVVETNKNDLGELNDLLAFCDRYISYFPDLEALLVFSTGSRFFKGNWQAHHTKGLVLYCKSSYDEAIKSYHRAIMYSKNQSYWSYHDLGNCLTKIGDACKQDRQKEFYYSSAEVYYKKAIQLCPDSDSGKHWLYHDLGYILKQQKKFLEAIKYFEEAIALKQDNAWAYHEIAGCYNEMSSIGDLCYSKAEEFARKAIGLLRDPFEAKSWVHYELARSLEGQSRFDEAKKEYAQALFLCPNNWFAKDGVSRLKDK